mgnify:FL=1
MLAWHLAYKCTFVRAHEIDLFSGRLDPEDEVEEEVPTTLIGKIVDKLL